MRKESSFNENMAQGRPGRGTAEYEFKEQKLKELVIQRASELLQEHDFATAEKMLSPRQSEVLRVVLNKALKQRAEITGLDGKDLIPTTINIVLPDGQDSNIQADEASV